ncbi:hypothetical protein HY522_01580 [bacterium]|nr:hypothetical protein [bacterium]
MDAKAVRDLNARRGQGMVEYLMVLAVVLGGLAGALTLLSQSGSLAVKSMMSNIESVTGVRSPSE